MIKQTPGKIFLAERRRCQETAQFRRLSTMEVGLPGSILRAVHEEALTGGQGVALPVAEAVCVLVLPVTGSVAVGSPASEAVLEVEEAYVLLLPAGSTLHLRNPYATHPIALLHVWLAAPAPPEAAGQRFAFQHAALLNNLWPIVPGGSDRCALPFCATLGQFAGRAEAVYRPRPATQLFAYVLAGAFEVEGRLLHANDGLALWGSEEVELEALSHNALVLVLELPA